jgi:hypothetical protein
MGYCKLFSACAVVAAMVGFAAPALAGPNYTFSVSSGTQPTNVGTITLTQTSLDSVTIDLQFSSSIYGIMNSGAKIPFGFELDSAALAETIGITFIHPAGTTTATYLDPQSVTDTFSLDHSGGSQAGVGVFNTSIDDTAGNGSSHAYYGELDFVLTCTANCPAGGLSTNDFTTVNGVYFTADLTDGSNTGVQSWSTRCVEGCSRQVPEPVTLSLFGAGLAGAAALRRRRKKA